MGVPRAYLLGDFRSCQVDNTNHTNYKYYSFSHNNLAKPTCQVFLELQENRNSINIKT